jgi:PTH1 family peptidyl-tRNA hydrolase
VILVVGLGNPGRRYEDTRHNVGFLVADELCRRATGASWRSRFSAEFAQADIGRERLGLLKPQTYMNESGHAVRQALAFFKLDRAALVVVHDEMDLGFGVVRLKKGGGEAGHNGLRSISGQLGSSDYVRLRFGIGRPPREYGGNAADYVLEAFAPPERAQLAEFVTQAADTVLLLAKDGLDRAMNVTNQRAKGSN